MSKLVDCGKLCTCNITPRVITKNLQRDTLKNTTDNQKQILKFVQVFNRKAGKCREIKKQKQNKKLNGSFSSKISIITLTSNGLNIPINSQRLKKWIKKSNTTIYHPQKPTSNIMMQKG